MSLFRRFVQAFGKFDRSKSFLSAHRTFNAGDIASALEQCSRLVGKAPDWADGWFLLGLIHEKNGALNDAKNAIQRALKLREDLAFHCLLAKILLSEIEPNNPETVAVVKSHLDRAKELAEAKGADLSVILEMYTKMYHRSGDNAQARRFAAQLRGAHGDAKSHILELLSIPEVFDSTTAIAEFRKDFISRIDEMMESDIGPLKNPEKTIATTPFYLAYHGLNDREIMGKIGRLFRKIYVDPGDVNAARKLRRDSRLRVGFVSTFFFSHSVGRTTIGLIKDLQRDKFDVYVFAIKPTADTMASAIRSASDHYVSLDARLDLVCEAIKAAELDVLIFADIGMDPLTYFLAYWRLAPIQMTTWGHPITSGIDSIDYYFSNRTAETDSAQDHYTEKLILLDGPIMPGYSRPMLTRDMGPEATYGFAEGYNIYACLQSLFKIHPDFDETLAEILERDENAAIVMLDQRPNWTKQLFARLARTVGDDMRRIFTMSGMDHQRYLNCLKYADVVIDPHHFGGCNSSCEAFSLGTPVVALPSQFLRARFTQGYYREMGLTELVPRNSDEYVSLAVSLGSEDAFRRDVSNRLTERCSALFERPESALSLGDQLTELVELRANG